MGCLNPVEEFRESSRELLPWVFYAGRMLKIATQRWLENIGKSVEYGGPSPYQINFILSPYSQHKHNDKIFHPLKLSFAKFIRFLKNYSNPKMEIAFRAERSVEDDLERSGKSDIVLVCVSYVVMFVYISVALGEITSIRYLLRSVEDDRERSSKSDIVLVCVSYVVMFVYISVAVGEITSIRYLLEKSKITLGLFGVMIILLSIMSSLGIFCFLRIHATLLIFEVIPFLVMAVGIDNIFILMQTFQRDDKKQGESLEEQIGRVVGEIAPTMMLSSISMSSCFFIGIFIDMPAVKIFALYADVALLINFSSR